MQKKQEIFMHFKGYVALLVLLAACTTPTAGGRPGTETAQSSEAGTSSQAPGTLPAPALPGTTQITPSSEPYILTVISPLDNSTVSAPQINLIGKVSRGTVLTINDYIYVLGAGDFTIPFTLEEGPNVLEIVASDYDGNEVDVILTVSYQP